jgi:hypothetical protein
VTLTLREKDNGIKRLIGFAKYGKGLGMLNFEFKIT